jgi:hypothetical protein
MKFFPASMPKALQSGYTSKHAPNILRTQMSDGYCRQRLVNQGAPDTVSVSFVVTETQYRDFLSWFKADIQCGASWFVIPLLSVDAAQSIAYRYARIQNGEVTAAVISTNPTQGTIYKVSMTLDVSNTVIDDGSWEDHYLPDDSVGGEFGALSNEEGSRIADIDSVIEDDVDAGASIGTATTTESASTYDEV